jgi:hypothetical protein
VFSSDIKDVQKEWEEKFRSMKQKLERISCNFEHSISEEEKENEYRDELKEEELSALHKSDLVEEIGVDEFKQTFKVPEQVNKIKDDEVVAVIHNEESNQVYAYNEDNNNGEINNDNDNENEILTESKFKENMSDCVEKHHLENISNQLETNTPKNKDNIYSVNIPDSHMFLLKGLTENFDTPRSILAEQVNIGTIINTNNSEVYKSNSHENEQNSSTELNKEVEDSIIHSNRDYIVKEVKYDTNTNPVTNITTNYITTIPNIITNNNNNNIHANLEADLIRLTPEDKKISFPALGKSNDLTQDRYNKNDKEKENNNNNKSKLDQSKYIPEHFLKGIEVAEHEKVLETQKTMEEIQAIEANLKLNERLYHDKWQIRKNAYKEVGELLNFIFMDKSEDNEVKRMEAIDTFSPWLKYFISDINVGSLTEGLNTFYIFLTHCAEVRHKALLEFFDELEKLVSMNKNFILDLCKKIISFGFGNKKLNSFIFNELLKKLNSGNYKLLLFIVRLFTDLINEKNAFLTENYLKIIFEKSVINFNSANKIERQKLYSELIQKVYSIILDDYDSIKKFNTNTNSKEVFKVLKNVKKDDNSNIVLYERPNQVGQQGDNSISININEQEEAAQHEASDLFSILPVGFLEYQNLDSYGPKKAILESFNSKLSDISVIRDKDRDYNTILKIIQEALDDSNILVHTEGVKCLSHIGRLLKMNLNQAKLKNLLISSFEIFKDKKSIIKLEMFYMFDSLIMNFCINLDSFIILVLQQANWIKIPIVKQSLLEYVKYLFTENESENYLIIKGIICNLSENDYISFAKLLAEIIKGETQPVIKDLCVDIMINFKHRVKNETKLKAIIELLPQYRKNMVIAEKNNYSVEEKEYKAGLKRIKSGLSFRNVSTSKDRSISNVAKTEEKRSVSRGREVIKNKLTTKSVVNTEEEKNNSKRLTRMNTDSKLAQTHKRSNSIKVSDTTSFNIKKVDISKNDMNNSLIENPKNSQKNKTDKKTTINKLEESSQTLQQSNRTNKSLLEQKMDDIIDSIYKNKNKADLQSYCRDIIKDFLMFIKKESNRGDSREDLNSHFGVIINILDKIYDQLGNSIPDDIYTQTFKIVVMGPCFLTNYNILIKFIKKVRRILNDDERLFSIYSGVLFKFYDIDTDAAFIKNINPKFTVMLYFEYFLTKENNFKIYTDAFDVLLDYINRLVILSDDEKERYFNLYHILSGNKFNKEAEISHEKSDEQIPVKNNNYNPYNNTSYDNSHMRKDNPEISHIDGENDLSAFSEKDIKSCLTEQNIKNNQDDEHKDNNEEEESEHEERDDWRVKYELEKEARMNTQKELYIQDLETKRIKEKLNQLSKYRTDKLEEIEKVENSKPDLFNNQQAKNNNNTSKIELDDSSINKSTVNNDILRIKELLKKNCTKLDSTIQRLNSTIENKTINTESSQAITRKVNLDDSELNNLNVLNSHNFNPITTPQSNYFKPQKSLEDVYNEKETLGIKANKFSTLNSDLNTYICENPLVSGEYNSLLLKIPTNLLDDRVTEIAVYVKLESIFFKLAISAKANFTAELKKILDNPIMVKNSSFNCFLQLLEFLLKLLTNVNLNI